MSGGAEANKSGLTWEAWIKTVAQGQGFEVKNYRDRETCEIPISTRRVVWTHAPYETIFRKVKEQQAFKTSTEFVVECGTDLVRIECKWQAVSGSVDEKFAFMFLNAVCTMTEPTIVFALGGAYFEGKRGEELRDWLMKSCASPPDWLSESARARLHGRSILVLNTNTFAKWFRDRFPP